MLLITTLKVYVVLDWKVGRDIEFRCRFMRGTMTEDSKRNSESDSSLVWSTEDAKYVAVLLSRYNGDLNVSLKALFGSSCSVEMAVRVSERYAQQFGLTHMEFMSKYRKWKKGEL